MNSKPLWQQAALLLLLIVLPGCLDKQPPETPAPSQVTVQAPKQEPVVDYLEITGTVSASKTVNLVARVVGYLETVNFKDGSYVEEGQLLFTIEPKSYEEVLALDEAQLNQAQAEYDRQQALIKQNATSTASVENWRSKRDQAAAQVELAKLNLSYTKVRAPFAGRIGRRLVDPGNLVGAGGATQLATLDQLTPIYVYFNLNEQDVLRVRQMMSKQGIQPFSQVGTARVEAALRGEDGFPHQGVLDFTDSSLSPSTGTLQLRAVLKNEDKALFPGLFADVRIPLGKPKPMLVVSDEAIGSDQQGEYVLVVNSSGVAERRNIEKGTLSPHGRVVRSGLSQEDRVIVAGLQNARPGAKVQVASPAKEPSGK